MVAGDRGLAPIWLIGWLGEKRQNQGAICRGGKKTFGQRETWGSEKIKNKQRNCKRKETAFFFFSSGQECPKALSGKRYPRKKESGKTEKKKYKKISNSTEQ